MNEKCYSYVELTAVNTSSPPRQAQWRRGLLLTIILVALPIRLYLSTTAAMISRDGVSFIWYAQELARDPIAEMRRQAQHPLYPAMVLAAHKTLSGLQRLVPASILPRDPVWSWQAAAMSVTLIGGLAVVAAVYALTRTLFNARIALLAALLAAATAEFCQLSADALTDMPHLAVYLFALTAGIRGLSVAASSPPRAALPWLFASGVLSGVAYLLRPEGAEPAVAVALMAIALKSSNLRQRSAALAAVILGAALIASPYMLVTGKLVQKKSIGQFLPWTHADLFAPKEPRASARAALLLSRPSVVVPHAARPESLHYMRMADVGGQHATSVLLNATKALGIIAEKYARSLRVTFLLPAIAWLLLRRKTEPEAQARVYRRVPVHTIAGRVVAIAMCLHFVILFALIFRFDYWDMMSVRHVMILAGLTLPFAAAGVAAILDLVPQPRRRTTAALLAVGLVAPTLPWMLAPPNADNRYLRRTGEWLRANSEPAPRVLTTRHPVAFYANGIHVRSPLEVNVGAILAEARAQKPDYLVFDERRMLREKPDFFDALESSLQPGESLQQVHVEPQQQKRWLDRAIVYRYRPPP